MNQDRLVGLLDKLKQHDEKVANIGTKHVVIGSLLFCLSIAPPVFIALHSLFANGRLSDNWGPLGLFALVFSLIFGLNLKFALKKASVNAALRERGVHTVAVLRDFSKTCFSRKNKRRRDSARYVFHLEAIREQLRFTSDMVSLDEGLTREGNLSQIRGWVADVFYLPEDPEASYILLGSLRPGE